MNTRKLARYAEVPASEVPATIVWHTPYGPLGAEGVRIGFEAALAQARDTVAGIRGLADLADRYLGPGVTARDVKEILRFIAARGDSCAEWQAFRPAADAVMRLGSALCAAQGLDAWKWSLA